MPLGVSYNIKQAELKNVTAYLIKNEVQVIPLHYTSDGLYKSLYEFYVREGESYELVAESNKKFTLSVLCVSAVNYSQFQNSNFLARNASR